MFVGNGNIPIEKINFQKLLKAASYKAKSKSELNKEYHFIFSILDVNDQVRLRLDLNTYDCAINQIKLDFKIEHEEYSEIIIDYRYLYGLLTSIYHWNNAEVGSNYFTVRYPLDNYNQKVQRYLNFLTTA